MLTFHLVSQYIHGSKNKMKESCLESFLAVGQVEVILIELPLSLSVPHGGSV
jgi:hypothetical protein